METNGLLRLPEVKDNFCCICVHGVTNLYSIYPPLNQVKIARQNILTSYTYKSFAARIELVIRESQEKINVEILQIGTAKIGLAKYNLILDSNLPFS